MIWCIKYWQRNFIHVMNTVFIFFTPNRYGRFLLETKVPPGYNNSQKQTAREHCWKFKFSLEPYRELSLKQRKVSVYYDTLLSRQ